MPERSFDIILIGATGFTGKRAVKYLSNNAPENLNWGIAARNSEKLQTVADRHNISREKCFIIDTTNRAQVESVVQQTRIILTTVGPFSLYGEEVIAACSRFGTHYLDITGEVGFIKEMKEKYGSLAQKSGAAIIPFSGFDSIPAEIAAYSISNQFQHTPEKLTIRAHYSISGGFNGGTIATMLNKFETGEYKKMNDPSLLLDGDIQNIHKPARGQFIGFDQTVHRWSTPFIMSSINSKVVYKTAEWMHDQGKPYAKSIAYSEHINLGKWYNPLTFLMITAFLIFLQMLGPKKWFRSLIKKFAPAPGDGPSEEQIENGYFKMETFGTNEKSQTESIRISYPGDPGNKSTVFFLCESALLLAGKHNFTKTGFLTPASAFENELINHLKAKGLRLKGADIVEV